MHFDDLFDHSVIHNIEIVIDPAEWRGLVQDMVDYNDQYGYKQWTNFRTGNYRRARFILHTASGDYHVDDVGFRTRGNTTRIVPQDEYGNFHRAHFKIKFNETFDLSEIDAPAEYRAQKKRRFAGVRALNLKWSHDNDPTLIRELYSYDLLHRAGVHASRTGSARLAITIGKETTYFGVYTMIEPVDKSFLTRRLGPDRDRGNLYKCLWQFGGPAVLERRRHTGRPAAYFIGVKNWHINHRPTYDLKTNKDRVDHTAFLNFIDQLNSRDGADLQSYLDQVFDTDRFLRFLAINELVGMPDDNWSMGNNYFLYHAKNQPIRFIPFDYDHGLGGGWHPFDTANADILRWHNMNREMTGIDYPHPLADKMLTIAAYRERYKAYLRQFLARDGGIFSHADYLAKYNALAALYTPHLDNDIDQAESMSNQYWAQKDAGWVQEGSVEDYFATRIASVLKQLENAHVAPAARATAAKTAP